MSDCVMWQGQLDVDGYGRLRGAMAHRVEYENKVGPIPDGMELDHLCKERACVNTDHLEPVTRLENIRRSDAPSQINRRKTHCNNGHPLSGENLYIWKGDGFRRCKACNRQAVARHQQRNTE